MTMEGEKIMGEIAGECAPDARCAWCGIRARAVPDEPPVLWEGAWYHRRGCYTTARSIWAGTLPADHQPIEVAWR